MQKLPFASEKTLVHFIIANDVFIYTPESTIRVYLVVLPQAQGTCPLWYSRLVWEPAAGQCPDPTPAPYCLHPEPLLLPCHSIPSPTLALI